jgi:hypothetical protein
MAPYDLPPLNGQNLGVCVPLSAAGPLAHSCEALNGTPLNLTTTLPVIPKEKILLIEGSHDDAICPKDDTEDLWQSWGQPDIWRLPHGHVGVCSQPGSILGCPARKSLRRLLVVLPGGMVPKPLDVRVVLLADTGKGAASDGRSCPWVKPFVDFRVTVREGKTAGAVMIAGRDVRQSGLGEIGVADHVDDEEAIVHAVRVLVQENPGPGGAWVDQVVHFDVFAEGLVAKPGPIALVHAHPGVHGIAAVSEDRLASDFDGGFVRWAFVDSG